VPAESLQDVPCNKRHAWFVSALKQAAAFAAADAKAKAEAAAAEAEAAAAEKAKEEAERAALEPCTAPKDTDTLMNANDEEAGPSTPSKAGTSTGKSTPKKTPPKKGGNKKVGQKRKGSFWVCFKSELRATF
jgi:membrane protein involved in colicin uptake